MKYNVYFWHGYHPSLEQKISKFCKKIDAINYEFEGTLEDFTKKWDRGFLLLKDSPKLKNTKYTGLLCISQYNSFGQR